VAVCFWLQADISIITAIAEGINRERIMVGFEVKKMIVTLITELQFI
jgi:hypothetical protein